MLRILIVLVYFVWFYAIVIPVFLLQTVTNFFGKGSSNIVLQDSARGARRKIENSDCLSSVKIKCFRTDLNTFFTYACNMDLLKK